MQFTGTLEEFNRYLGPYCRNRVQAHTRRYRTQVGKCEHCGSTSNLEAAHVRGCERTVLIAQALAPYNKDSVISVNLAEFDARFLALHEPISAVIKILCRACHQAYDQPQVDSLPETTAAPQAQSLSRGGMLPIELIPINEQQFKAMLLVSKRANITTFYNTGKTETKLWRADRFNEQSGVMNNLRSRPEFRQGSWQNAGIQKVVVEVIKGR